MLIYLSYRYKGNWRAIYDVVASKEYDFNDEDIKKEVSKLKSNAVTILDPEYPKWLHETPWPPFVIYYYGDLSLLNDVNKNIAVIGMRKNSAYGAEMTRYLVKHLCEDFVIVSGLARGIDGIAHEECLNHSGKTIAVLGNGIDFCYPPENWPLYKRIKANPNCLIISEYPGDIVPEPSYFPERNRLIAGSSKALIITEALKQSGTSITTAYALNLNKIVMAVPGEACKNSLCNQLIREGCPPVDDIDDVYIELGYIKNHYDI